MPRLLVRVEGEDLFGYGAREAVVRALAGDAGRPARRSGRPPSTEEMAAAVARVLGAAPEPVEGGLSVARGPAAGGRWRSRTAGRSRSPEEGPEKAVIRPLTP